MDESKGSVLVSVPACSVSRDRSITQNSNEGDSSQGGEKMVAGHWAVHFTLLPSIEKEKEKEKYKRMEATYLGCIDVPSPQGRLSRCIM